MALGVATAWAQAPRLPQRNLVVEVRQVVGEVQSDQRAGLSGGGVVVGTGGISARAGLEWRTDQREQGSGATQQVLVLNGGQAGVRVSAQTPWQFFQVARTPQGPSLLPSVAWIESATGFRVRPAWPGGQDPVTVELSAEGAPPGIAGPTAFGAAPASTQSQVLSTVQVPIGEWVIVARSVDEQSVDARGTLSSRSAERRTERSLQIRVLAP